MKIRFGNKSVSLRKLLGLKRDLPPPPPGYSHINRFLPEDVFIVGYPKSGNTWFQHLVSGVVYGVDARFSPPGLADDLVPDIHASTFYQRYSTPMFFKSHVLPNPDYRRVVYLLRDGRDAMVSFLHYEEAIARKKVDFLEMVTEGLEGYRCKWHEHVDAWSRNRYKAQMLIIKYEDLLSYPVEQLERFCRFVKLDRERSQLEAAAEASKFCHLRAKEARVGPCRNGWPTDRFFFRRGIIGSHRDEMPPDVLRAFLRISADTLRRNGYDIGDPASHNAPATGGSEPRQGALLVNFPVSMPAD
jgi:hypothetical protein